VIAAIYWKKIRNHFSEWTNSLQIQDRKFDLFEKKCTIFAAETATDKKDFLQRSFSSGCLTVRLRSYPLNLDQVMLVRKR
jgi:hypothetical protein